jgi:nucleoid-associated protein YgaU
MKPVRITAKNPEIDITVPMGDGPAYITGGLGGWVPVPLVDDVEAVDWEGQSPLTQDVPLLLNAYGSIERGDGLTPPDRNDDVEREWNTIKKLGRDANGDERKPPVFTVDGPVEHPDKAWVLGADGISVSPESILRRNGSGELLRIEFVLHLLEYTAPEVIKDRRRKKRRKSRMGISDNVAVGGTYTTKQGDTVAKIAARLLNDWKRWEEIGPKNGINDPNRVLPAGRRLRI